MSRVAKLLIMILLFLLSGTCYTQQWVSTFSNNTSNDLISEDKAYSILVSNSGYVYVTGFCTTDSSGTDICTIKYNQLGDTVWTQKYNGTGNSEDKAYAIVIDDLDNIYITGYTTSANTGIDIVTIKYTADGDMLWAKPYNGTAGADDKSQAICLDDEGFVYVTGYASYTDRGKDAIVIKYDGEGNQLWCYTYNYPNVNRDDIANAIVKDNQGYILITGSSMRGVYDGTEDMLTVKINPSTGTRIWSRVYNGSGYAQDKAYAITVDDLDNVIITGYSTNAAGSRDITTIKYYSSGYTFWINTEDYSEFDGYAKSIAKTPDYGVVVTGSSQSGSEDGTEDYITIKYGYYGNIEWVERYSGVSSDIAYSLVISELDNAVYITGSSKSDSVTGTEDMFTIEYDLTTGTLLDTARLDGLAGGEDVAYDIAIDTAGNVYLTGYTEPINGYDVQRHSSDYITVKYTGGNLLNRRSSIKVPEVFTLSQNYPNPFNPSTTIKFTVPNKGLVRLTVYDILGREVEVLVNQTLTRGDYSVKFDGSKLASGVYFYELTADSYKDVKKMILVK